MARNKIQWIESVLQDKEMTTEEILEQLRNLRKRPPSKNELANLLAGNFQKIKTEKVPTKYGSWTTVTTWKRRE